MLEEKALKFKNHENFKMQDFNYILLPVSIDIVVVFPAPLCPNNAVI